MRGKRSGGLAPGGAQGGQLRALVLGLACIATLGVLAGCGSSSSSSTSGSGSNAALGSSYPVAKAGKSTLTIWWLGDQEIPGIEGWMKRAIANYEKTNPNVTVNTVLESTSTYTTTQKTACRSGAGPDIWYNWGGVWSLEVAWLGCTVPNEAVLSQSDLSTVPAIAGTKWSGKTWVYPIEQRLYPIIYNKQLFEKAGISGTPQSWAEFEADLKKLQSAKIQPLITGLKDGFGGENLAVAFQRQVLPVKGLLESVVNAKMNTAEWNEWIQKAYGLRGYFNNDTNSITYSQGLARFQSGKAAMIFASPGWRQTLTKMNTEGRTVGIFRVPVYSNKNPQSKQLYEDTPGFQVTRFAKNPQLAGSFLAFLHSPAEIEDFYQTTGDIPSDNRWKPASYKSPVDGELVQWLGEGIDFYSANYYPTSNIDENGNFVVFQGMYGGNMTPEQAVNTYQTEITKWHGLQTGELANYTKWLSEYK